MGLFSGSISYGAGDPGAWMALNASEPTSVRLAQLRMEHGQAFALDAASDAATHSPHWPDLLAEASIWLGSFQALAALPATDFRLPMEAGAPDFAWGDVQAGAVAIKHGGVRLFASMQWRHGYLNQHAPRVPSNVALNNVTRVHYTVLDGGSVDHVMTVLMQPMAGENSGWGRLYAAAPIGNYTIAMNGAAGTALSWPLPAALVGTGAVDLVSGVQHCNLGKTLKVDAATTVVLVKKACTL